MTASPDRPRRFDLVVFDWDGTLFDSTALIVHSIQAACRDLGLPVPDDERASWVIGLSLRAAMEHAVPSITPEQIPALVDRYRFHYLARQHDLTLFPGVLDMLHALKRRHHWLAVATGKSRAGLDEALQTVELKGLFDGTRTADETRSKPDPLMLNELMRQFGCDPARTLMIGDTTHDLQLAANAGAPSVAVAYGAHQPSEFATHSPLLVAKTVAELAAWLTRMPEALAAADGALALCASTELAEAGKAVVFDVLLWRRPARAFALRFEGRVVAYLNRCAHVPTEMDWQPGEFLDEERRFIVCSMHGAVYEPTNGRCIAGPCAGARLMPIDVVERGGQVYWFPNADIGPAVSDNAAESRDSRDIP